MFCLDGESFLINDTFALNSVASGSSTASPVAFDGADYYSLAYGREWREGTYTPGEPANAGLLLANMLMASSVASVNNLVNTLDTSARSAGSPADTAVMDAFMNSTNPTNMVASYSNAGGLQGSFDASDSASLAGSLANNGGPTQTIALTAHTPLSGLGAGSPVVFLVVPSFDQRGEPRPSSGQVDIGSFQIVNPPTASLTSAPDVTAADALANTTTVQVTYSDTGGSGINTSTFGNGNITISNGATVTGHSATGNVVTYTITAPSATWATSTQGTYTINLVADSVQDTVGVGVAAASLGSFNVNTTSLTAAISGAVFSDYNQNGTPDPGEVGLANIMVYIDLTHAGTYVPGDPNTFTGPDGSYSFANLPSGTYTVAVQPTPGHVGTSAPLAVNLSGANMTGQNLGVLAFSPVAIVPVTANLFTPNGTGATAYVSSLYESVLGRTGSPTDVNNWVAEMNAGTTPAQVAAAFVNSSEHRWDQVDYYYSVFLNRAPDPTASTWVSMLQSGVSEQTVAQDLIMSSEFQVEHITDASFVSALYEDVLGRAASNGEISAWLSAITGGMSRSQVAAAFIGSNESYALLVQGDYASYLHPGLDPMAVDWINELEANSTTIDEVAISILSSTEYIDDVT